MKPRFKAFVVFSGQGDDYLKHGVYPMRRAADAAASAAVNRFNYRVWECECATKRDLENQIEDDLTDEQAQEYRVSFCFQCGAEHDPVECLRHAKKVRS